MSEALFPSGLWTGYYKYSGEAAKHRMELHLQFANGRLTGEGIDDIGRFSIRGHYDAHELDCYWTKTYVGAHDVYYRGFREGKGIWGVWEIGLRARGGFHIWPKGASEGESQVAQAEEPSPAEARPRELSVHTPQALIRPVARPGWVGLLLGLRHGAAPTPPWRPLQAPTCRRSPRPKLVPTGAPSRARLGAYLDQ